jgi:hypothetical protein
MKSIMTFIIVAIVLAAIASVFYGGYLVTGYIWQLFYGIDSTLRLILLSTFAVFLFGCFIIAGALKSASQTKLKAQFTEAKIDLYKTLVGLYEAYFSALQSGVKTSQQDTLLKLEEMNAELSMIAGGTVIESHRKLEQAVQRQESEESLSPLYQQLIKKTSSPKTKPNPVAKLVLRNHKGTEYTPQ